LLTGRAHYVTEPGQACGLDSGRYRLGTNGFTQTGGGATSEITAKTAEHIARPQGAENFRGGKRQRNGPGQFGNLIGVARQRFRRMQDIGAQIAEIAFQQIAEE